MKYSLSLKEDFSRYAWHSAATHETSAHTAQVLALWQRMFITAEYWILDQESHFIIRAPSQHGKYA